VHPYKDGNKFVGPKRVWKKGEQSPGLMMTRTFGDTFAHTIGVISLPEVKIF
jgi:hypothetical protein